MSAGGASPRSDSERAGHAATTSFAWLALSLMWTAYALNYADRQFVFSIFPALKSELHFSDVQLGLVGSVFTWVYSLSMPVTGALADGVGRRRAVVASIILWSCATIGTAVSYSTAQFLWMRALMGVTEALYVPAAYGLIASLFPHRLLSRVLAIHATAQFAGIIAGSSYGAWIADHQGWRPGLEWAGVVGAGYGIVVLFVFRKLPHVSTQKPRVLAFSLDAIRSRRIVCLIAAFSAFCLLLWIIYAWLPFFIYNRFHLSMTQSAVAISFLQVGSVLGVLLGGFLGDRFARKHTAARGSVAGVGLLLCAPVGWLIFVVPSVVWLQCAAVLFGILSGLFMANIFAAAMDCVPDRSYSFVTATINMAGGLAGGAGMLFTGFYRTSLGVEGVAAAAAALVGLSAIPLLSASFRRPSAVDG